MRNLFLTRRFWPLFVAMAFSAFNDNFYKNALVIYITYTLAAELGVKAEILISFAAACFIIPYFLFSGMAGLLADKFPKYKMARWLKCTEVLLVLCAAVALLVHHAVGMLSILFLLGTQATFFSPVKYAVLPELVPEHKLMRGNAIIEAGTFISILLGTSLGGLVVLKPHGLLIVSFTMLTAAVIGLAAAFLIPPTPPAVPGIVIPRNPFAGIRAMIGAVAHHHAIMLPIIGISWFWAIGATYLIQIPVLTKELIGGNEEVVTWFVALFSIGIAVGAMLSPTLVRKLRFHDLASLSLLGLTLFGLDLVWGNHHAHPASDLMGLVTYLKQRADWRMTADLFLMAVCGGIFVIPLYNRLQIAAGEEERARAIASNNVFNAFFMAVAAVVAAMMFAAHYSVLQVLLAFGLANFPMILLIRKYAK